jgi:hypothetical protein
VKGHAAAYRQAAGHPEARGKKGFSVSLVSSLPGLNPGVDAMGRGKNVKKIRIC